MDRSALELEAKRIVDYLAAEPRAAGSGAEARARAHCAAILNRNGFAVTEEEFVYSAFPGRWAIPLIGLLFFPWFVFIGSQTYSHPDGAAASGMPFLLLLSSLGYVLVRMISRSRPWCRRATNLFAARGGLHSLLLVAHLDSKSQPVPMLIRIAGTILVAAATLVAIITVVVLPRDGAGPSFWLFLSVAGAFGSLAMMLSVVGNRSRGAVDNATGVAAALLAATNLPGLCVLITSAEELGLQGARAWAREHKAAPATAINFDGIDDVGTLTCMSSRRSTLARRLRDWSERSGWHIRFRGVLPGIMVDALAFGAVGCDAVTISKGNFSTLARIHTPRDEPGRLTGAGVAEVVELVTNFLTREG